MCQIIWDSQFVHNAHILAVGMQHYSKTVSFQEIQCRGEVNIYLHNLTLLSDCLIFPSDFPLLFHSTPKLSFKTRCTREKKKRHDFPRGLGSQWSWWCNACSPLFLGAPWVCSCILPHSFPRLHHLHILLQHLQRLPPPLPPSSSQVIRTPAHLTPPPLFLLLLLLLLLSFPPPARPSAASP